MSNKLERSEAAQFEIQAAVDRSVHCVPRTQMMTFEGRNDNVRAEVCPEDSGASV